MGVFFNFNNFYVWQATMKDYNGSGFRFFRHVAVVTGASSGIFQAVAKGYAEAERPWQSLIHIKGAEETKKAIENMGRQTAVTNATSRCSHDRRYRRRVNQGFRQYSTCSSSGEGVLFRSTAKNT
jgi:hypothetical protein